MATEEQKRMLNNLFKNKLKDAKYYTQDECKKLGLFGEGYCDLDEDYDEDDDEEEYDD